MIIIQMRDDLLALDLSQNGALEAGEWLGGLARRQEGHRGMMELALLRYRLVRWGRRQETGGRGQETGGRRQETGGNRRQETGGNREEEIGETEETAEQICSQAVRKT